MLFNSFDFLVFFLVVFAVYWALPHRTGLYFLLGASYFFYGSWKWQYTGLLLLTTVLDFVLALLIAQASTLRKRKLLLAFSVVSNLSILGAFKYYNFFGPSISNYFGLNAIPLDVLLPVGISFYTFQSMSYTIDVYRGILKPRRSFVDFALFVSFFPQLVAGPIVRAVDFLPQLSLKPAWDWLRARSGLHLILRGLIEKVVIADNLAPIVEKVYADPVIFSGFDLWIGTYCFAFQILADFAGYTDIARGVAKMLGYEFLENFRRPYVAENISDFWRRWHISLSTWLRDYLYIPMGGSRKGNVRTYLNLMVTMILGGLWHGANWTFLFWGFFHGSFLALHHGFRDWRTKGKVDRSNPSLRSPLTRLLWMFLTFHVVCVGWVFFRASSIDAAIAMLGTMFNPLVQGFTNISLGAYLVLCVALQVYLILEEFLPLGTYFERLPMPMRAVTLLILLLILVIFVPAERVAFIYFQF
jgi:D-alanyl-lipoteichoic acid acyltransferase DltB (MBOAT superfamily)